MIEVIDRLVFGLQALIKNDYLLTFVISMLPMIEVRGAIPVALKAGMNPWVAYFFSCVSALVVAPILMIFLKPILNLLKKIRFFRRIAEVLEDGFKRRAEKIDKKADLQAAQKSQKRVDFYKILALYVFVAIPLPMTGVWTGAAIAVFLNMAIKKSVLPLVLGNFTAGLIIIAASLLLGDKSGIVILVLFGFIFITLITLIAAFIIKGRKKKSVVYTDKDG